MTVRVTLSVDAKSKNDMVFLCKSIRESIKEIHKYSDIGYLITDEDTETDSEFIEYSADFEFDEGALSNFYRCIIGVSKLREEQVEENPSMRTIYENVDYRGIRMSHPECVSSIPDAKLTYLIKMTEIQHSKNLQMQQAIHQLDSALSDVISEVNSLKKHASIANKTLSHLMATNDTSGIDNLANNIEVIKQQLDQLGAMTEGIITEYPEIH